MDLNEKKFYSASHKLPFMNESSQQILGNARILVIGVGGLGTPCLMALANMGVGNLCLVDYDTIEYSNLQRQTMYRHHEIGMKKVEVASQYLKKINPFINIEYHHCKIDKNNCLAFINSYDIIVDGTDNFESRYIINDACVVLNKTLVYGAVHQTEGHFTVFNYNSSATLRCLFPENEHLSSIQSCVDNGVYLVITQLIGIYMANEVIKIILNLNDISYNKLICINSISLKIAAFSYKKNIESINLSERNLNQLNEDFSLSIKEIVKIQKEENTLVKWIDISTSNERINFPFIVHKIPPSKFIIQELVKFLNESKIITVLICDFGVNSKKCVQILRKSNINHVYYLKNGLKNIDNEFNALKNS